MNLMNKSYRMRRCIQTFARYCIRPVELCNSNYTVHPPASTWRRYGSENPDTVAQWNNNSELMDVNRCGLLYQLAALWWLGGINNTTARLRSMRGHQQSIDREWGKLCWKQRPDRNNCHYQVWLHKSVFLKMFFTFLFMTSRFTTNCFKNGFTWCTI